MLLELLQWIMNGTIAVFITALIHVVVAEFKGYEALKWWEEHDLNIFKDHTRFEITINILFGLIIWPVRILEWLMFYIPKLYNVYERKTH